MLYAAHEFVNTPLRFPSIAHMARESPSFIAKPAGKDLFHLRGIGTRRLE